MPFLMNLHFQEGPFRQYLQDMYNSVIVNVLLPIEVGASCFNENSATDSKELRRLTLSPQA